MSGRSYKRSRKTYKSSANSSRKGNGKGYTTYHRTPGQMAARVGGSRSGNVRTAGFLGVEHKFYDTALVSCPIVASTSAAGGECDPSATSLISTPPQGDTASSRDGKRIVIESVQLQGDVFIPSRTGITTLDDAPVIFVALIQDTQTNAATVESEDVFVNPSGSLNTASGPLKNLLSGKRFITHKIWQINVGQLTAVSEADNNQAIMGVHIPFSVYKKLTMEVDFNGGTTASVANVVNNSLHVIAYVNDASWAAVLSYNARIRFVG